MDKDMGPDEQAQLSDDEEIGNLEMDEDMGPDEQAQSSDDKDIGSTHIPKVNLRQDWWKPFKEERSATPEPTWLIPSSDVPVPTNKWASAQESNYSPPPEDSLLAQTGDIAIFMDWFCKRRGITKLKPQDLGGPAFEIVKIFHPDVEVVVAALRRIQKLQELLKLWMVLVGEEEEVADEVETHMMFLVTRDSFSFSCVLQPSLVRVLESDHGH
nr:hypothetical protein [Tanacetum cinerariifolium]